MAHSFESMKDYIAARARNSDPSGTLVRNSLRKGRAELIKLHGSGVMIEEFTVAGTALTSSREILLRGEPIMLRAYKLVDGSEEVVVAGELVIHIRSSKLAKLR